MSSHVLVRLEKNISLFLRNRAAIGKIYRDHNYKR